MYRKYVVIEKGEMVLYVPLLKALYGYLRSALLFYRKLLADLESRRLKLNQYDPFAINKIIDGKQFTITWNMDYLKLSHVDKKVVDEMIEWMKGLYGQDMIIPGGNNHYYLAMVIELSVRGQVAVTIV